MVPYSGETVTLGSSASLPSSKPPQVPCRPHDYCQLLHTVLAERWGPLILVAGKGKLLCNFKEAKYSPVASRSASLIGGQRGWAFNVLLGKRSKRDRGEVSGPTDAASRARANANEHWNVGVGPLILVPQQARAPAEVPTLRG